MFRVKICGITSGADAGAACDAGADAIGINFFSGSPRCCTLKQAQAVARAVRPGVVRVGVFVNSTADEVRRVAAETPLDLVQLHGDEPPELLRELRPLPAVRVFRVQADLNPVRDYLAQCHRLQAWPRMALVDACRTGEYGGTGQKLDWPQLAKERSVWHGMPLILAGGLNPQNVAAAIATVRPWAVDVASGVEDSPGRKSVPLMVEFVHAAREAFARLRCKHSVGV